MSLSPFDNRYVSLCDLALLREIAGGDTRPRAGTIRLIRKRLLSADGLYKVKVTDRGKLALNYIFEGSRVVVVKHRLSDLIGKVGTVLTIRESQSDTDGYDEYGYQNRWAQPFTYVTAKLNDELGEWCFYGMEEIEPVFVSGQSKAGHFGLG
jgi:hypothetical protein